MIKNELRYLECHGDRHDWDPIELSRGSGRQAIGYKRVRRCTNCHGLSFVTYTRYGIVINRWYEMPKDYKGPVGMTKADWRKAYFDSLLKKVR